jgi:polysaccharide chain length determinant protein (PEP-CTERM system associated)
MEEKLAELRTRYTEQHPDVVAARRVLEALKSAPRSSSNAPGGGPAGNSTLLSNPVYEQIKLRLIEAEGTLASLQGRLEVARKELERMEKLALATPQVEAEYQDLDRGYNVVRKNYEELISRRESSKITSAADTGADKVRMRIIDPPQIANNPVAPNRLLLNSVVLAAGLGAVVALGFLFSQSDRSIPNLARLRELGYPVLGSISMLPEYNKGRKIVFQQAGVAAALLMLVVVYGGVATNHIPIDNIINKARLLL